MVTPLALQLSSPFEPRRHICADTASHMALVRALSITPTDMLGQPALVARSTVHKPLVEAARAHTEDIGLHRRRAECEHQTTEELYSWVHSPPRAGGG